MTVPVEVQLWRSIVLFVWGAVMAMCMNAYTAFRSVFPMKRLHAHTLDVLFVIVALASLAAVLYAVNYASIRLYVLVSILLGYATSHLITGPVVYHYCRQAFLLIRKFLLGMISTINKRLNWVKCKLAALKNRFKKPH